MKLRKDNSGTVLVNFKATREEREEMKMLADTIGMTLSDYIRHLMIEDKKRREIK